MSPSLVVYSAGASECAILLPSTYGMSLCGVRSHDQCRYNQYAENMPNRNRLPPRYIVVLRRLIIEKPAINVCLVKMVVPDLRYVVIISIIHAHCPNGLCVSLRLSPDESASQQARLQSQTALFCLVASMSLGDREDICMDLRRP